MTKVNSRKARAIVDAYINTQDGAPALAKKYGVGETTIYRVLGKHKVKVTGKWEGGKRGRGKLTETQRKEFLRRYDLHETVAVLCKEFNISYQTARSLLLSYDRKLRGSGGHRHISEKEIDEIVKNFQNGETQVALSARYRIHQTGISRLLTKRGIMVKGKPRGEKHGNWKGGRITTKQGYIMLQVRPDSPFFSMATTGGYVMEHRLVMAQHLGRPLTKDETIHHINGKVTDNRLENLQLRRGKHGKNEIWRCANCGSTNIVAVEIA